MNTPQHGSGDLPAILVGLIMVIGSIGSFIKRLRRIDLYLGHGRALESFLIFVKLQYFLMFALGPTILDQDPIFIAFSQLEIDPRILSLPFLCAWLPSLIGLYLNAIGNYNSRYYRIGGAIVGCTIWFFVIVENCLLGAYLAGVNPWVVAGILASLWIIRRGRLDLPTPGAVGEV